MERATQQNAALVEASAAAAESLKGQAQQLVAAVGVFKLPPAGAHGSVADVEQERVRVSVGLALKFIEAVQKQEIAVTRATGPSYRA